jgi:hypothetical protein
MHLRTKALLAGGFVIFIVVPSIILFSVSFSTLDATEYIEFDSSFHDL